MLKASEIQLPKCPLFLVPPSPLKGGWGNCGGNIQKNDTFARPVTLVSHPPAAPGKPS